ncbi:SDR family oxidoreductase [Janibacter melonis]|uniref:SDR family oxidoreductase n=1 Tax=Janibacter melonis TaxID=262209 RepID=A0A5P8FNJ4_9MICO|nr:SDR family oxidoreductase [Janibacter melonis]MCB5990617.1 SDR family oxidoreductase [Janibacter melonis]QFQ30504.2 SDR family oxidoreductase [Janibacter melonis]
MSDQLDLDNPVERHPTISPPEQDQDFPGSDVGLEPGADIGLSSYRGTGRLQGRKALVTGADSGIGAAVAVAFAREGADVALAYLPDEEEDADRVARVVEEEGGTLVRIPGDVRDRAYCDDLVAKAVEGLGGLDVLVVNAGKQVACEDITELTDEQLDGTLKTNLYAMVWICRAAVPHLQPGSSIIMSSSIQAYQPSAHLVDYAMTKAGMNTFAKGLSQQLAPKGIRVNAVAPGPVWTPLQVVDGQPKEALPEFGQDTPLGRAGQPVELAPAYVFLASAESSFVVGETLNVNGGQPSP